MCAKCENPLGFSKTEKTHLLKKRRRKRIRRYEDYRLHHEMCIRDRHTAEGKKMLRNFVYNVCGCTGDWKMDSFVENNVKALRERIGDGKVLCALSGGVDSSVLAAMLRCV